MFKQECKFLWKYAFVVVATQNALNRETFISEPTSIILIFLFNV